jgi:anti-sigma28 factor (negative regulator of flagellin synthesis)
MTTQLSPRVLAIRNQILAGTYIVDLDQLARRILHAEPAIASRPPRPPR